MGNMDEREAIVEQLRATMLRAVLAQQPLPGSERPISFPDLAFITSAPRLLIVDDNLSAQFDPGELGRPVEVVIQAEVRARAEREGDLAYVYYQPAEWLNERVRIAIEVRMAPTQPDLRPLGLGGISATFAQTDGDWIVVDGPTVMAI
jgi:hypothetical protein